MELHQMPGDAAAWWAGDAGNEYTERNATGTEAARDSLWVEILLHVHPLPKSILEVGANIGLNLHAIRKHAGQRWDGVEPNPNARVELRRAGFGDIDGTAQRIPVAERSYSLVFTCGVLIHIPPTDLLQVCAEIHRASKRHIVCIEYFSAEPRMVPYRGDENRLWTRDFGSFWLDNFDVEPVVCGFAWKRLTGLDNLTWWVFRKRDG